LILTGPYSGIHLFTIRRGTDFLKNIVFGCLTGKKMKKSMVSTTRISFVPFSQDRSLMLRQKNTSLKSSSSLSSLSLQARLQLAPGATEFLEFLLERNIPFTIATASGIENVDFYFEHLGLSRYFERSKVIYNNGGFPGKPNPHIFQKAMTILGLKGTETLVFEDSLAGIVAAERAQAGEIIAVDSNGEDYSRWDYQVIKSFSEVVLDIFVL